MSFPLKSFVVYLGVLFASGEALAQARLNLPPDPGRVLKNIEETERREESRNLRQIAPVVTPESVDSGKLSPEQLDARISVKGFQLEGVSLIPKDELLALLQPMVGRSLTLPELIRQIQVVTAAYAKRGFVARTFIPEQEVVDGVVRVEVIEGKLGSVDIQREEGLRFSEEQVRQIVLARQNPGDPIQIKNLERSMLLLNDRSGIEARSTLQPGEKPGVSNEIISVKSRPLISGSVDFDNYGVRSVGQNRLGALVRLNNVDWQGGQITLNAMAMFVDGSTNSYGSLGYQTPIGNDGLLFQMGGSQLDYRLGEQYESLNIEGKTDSLYIGAQYPVIRSGIDNLSVMARLERRDLKSTATDKCVPLSDKEVDFLQAGVIYDRLDGAADSFLTATGILTTGKVRFGPAQTFSFPGCGNSVGFVQVDPFGTQGNYTKINLNASYQKRLNNRLTISMVGTGQYAFTNLDSSEQTMLGGPYGVRAYPSSEAAGDEGLITNFEMRYRLWEGLVGTAFFDAGYIRRRHDAPSTPGTKNEASLFGTGLGLYYGLPGRVSIGSVVAWRIGDNPLRNADGSDSDGQQRDPRFWLTASIYF